MDDRVTHLSQIDPADVLYADDKHFNLGDSQKQLALLVNGAKQILEYPTYWEELPQPTKDSIVAQIDALLNVVTNIKLNRDDAAWLATNLENQKTAITSAYNNLYLWLVSSIREYVSALSTQKQEAGQLLKELRQATKSAKQTSKLASEASSAVATTELSKFFDELAVGEATEKKRHWFKGTSYKADSRRWFAGVIISVIATVVTAYFAFRGVSYTKITLNEVIARGLFLTAPAYAIKFCARNYSLNKQLQVTNTHRSVVMKTLLAFMAREEISPEVRASVVVEAASQVFKPSDMSPGDGKDTVIEVPVPWKKT